MDKNTLQGLALGLLIAGLVIVGYNFVQLKSPGPVQTTAAAAVDTASFDAGILPKGVPRIYGAELGVSYDDVSASNQAKADSTISKLGNLDTSIRLDGTQKERYIRIASMISCEYCCGTESIIFQDGNAACGCAHSYAMRGIAKYLITNHGNEFTDDEILEEMSKWKVLFFPSQSSLKAKALESKGIDATFINIASNNYRGKV